MKEKYKVLSKIEEITGRKRERDARDRDAQLGTREIDITQGNER